jgi:hypothetical protein
MASRTGAGKSFHICEPATGALRGRGRPEPEVPVGLEKVKTPRNPANWGGFRDRML